MQLKEGQNADMIGETAASLAWIGTKKLRHCLPWYIEALC